MSAVTHLVYRLYGDSDNLLYVGVTQNWVRRREHHAVVQPWFNEVARAELESCPTRKEAILREASLIRELKPHYNIQHQPPPPRPIILPSSDDMEDEYLTTKEAAAALGMTQSAVQNALISGRLRGTKFGRDWQISAREVELYRATPKRSQGGRPRTRPTGGTEWEE